jgi:transcriptional regulator with XRE-family HTH domain
MAAMTGIGQATISAVENSRANLGIARANILALALQSHPAV